MWSLMCLEYRKFITSCLCTLCATKSTNPASYLQPPTTPNVFANSQQTPILQILFTATHHFSWHFTCRQPCFFFHRQNIQTPSLFVTSNPATSSLPSPSPPGTPLTSQFLPLPQNLKSSCPNKQSDSDSIPNWLLKECSSVLVPTTTNIVKLSLSTGQFHPTLNESVISPLLKKPTLVKEELSRYRPISNLSLISKVIERVIKSGLTDHLTSNSLLNSHQSAYCKHHSTETALLYIHDHLVSAIGSQKVSCLCLLDLSAAFDTTDHDILITRLEMNDGSH